MKYHCMTIEETEALFETSVAKGISYDAARWRLNKYGPNSIATASQFTYLSILVRQFINPLMIILIIATTASLLIGEYNDAIVIGIAIAINVIIGFFQEWKSEVAIKKLLALQTKFALVRRDGKPARIDSTVIVPGDIVLLSEGDQIPADLRIAEAVNLQVEEAALTGESIPISKREPPIHEEATVAERSNMAYSGTYVVRGSGIGIVVGTGKETELGQIASLVSSTQATSTPLQQQIIKLSRFIGTLLIGLTILVCSIGAIYGLSLHHLIALAIAISVAAIPEGLIISITVILVVGMQRMLAHNALVRNLLAAETLGSVSVVCTDKTGTLTSQGIVKDPSYSEINEKLSDRALFLPDNHKPSTQNDVKKDFYQDFVTTVGILNNNAIITSHPIDGHELFGDPLEVALLRYALDTSIDPEKIRAKYPRIAELPFSTETKLMATTHSFGDKQLTILKGAPEAVLNLCINGADKFKQQASDLASKGRRILAVAITTSPIDFKQGLPKKFEPVTLLVFHNPQRPEAKHTIETMKAAGINVVMVTGDHPETAVFIASKIGLDTSPDNLIVGGELSKMSDAELSKRITKTSIFARVAPHDKIRIVHAWQHQGHVTAMTGDGINDAPALKAADIGVSQGSGSGIAHSISGIVLLDDNLSTICEAIHEGRIIFDNIRKVIVYLLADGFTQIVLLACALITKLPIPLLPIQILWINIVTDGLPGMALAAEPGEPGIMLEKPRQPDEPIINTEMKTTIFIIGIITDILLFSMYATLIAYNFEINHVRTMMFHGVAIATLAYIFSIRSSRQPIYATNPFSNRWLIYAIVISLFIQLSCSFFAPLATIMRVTPLSYTEWGVVFGIAPIKLLLIELTKGLFRGKSD